MPDDGDSGEQRRAEAVIRALAAEYFGVQIEPRRITTPHGGRIDLDGVAEDDTVLLEIYAHQGAMRGAQPKKVMTDAYKLVWSRPFVAPSARTVLALSCHEAARSFMWDESAEQEGRRQVSWMAEGLHDLGVQVVVFELPGGGDDVRAAQVRQFR